MNKNLDMFEISQVLNALINTWEITLKISISLKNNTL